MIKKLVITILLSATLISNSYSAGSSSSGGESDGPKIKTNQEKAVKLVKSGQVQFKAEKNGIVQADIAKSNFGAKNIVENINSFVDTIKKSRPSGAKGTFINKISLSSTMGVSVNCEIN